MALYYWLRDDLSVATMAEILSADEKIALIKQNLQEVLKPEIIENVIKNENRPLIIYWGEIGSHHLLGII